MGITGLLKMLLKEGVFTQILYDTRIDMFYLDLLTQSKSHLHVYENGDIKGRYGYLSHIDLDNDDIEEMKRELCIEFKTSMCGKPHFKSDWGDLCEKMKIELIKTK